LENIFEMGNKKIFQIFQFNFRHLLGLCLGYFNFQYLFDYGNQKTQDELREYKFIFPKENPIYIWIFEFQNR
jgi:hypothetical protein